jgi:hypothetical protein
MVAEIFSQHAGSVTRRAIADRNPLAHSASRNWSPREYTGENGTLQSFTGFGVIAKAAAFPMPAREAAMVRILTPKIGSGSEVVTPAVCEKLSILVVEETQCF